MTTGFTGSLAVHASGKYTRARTGPGGQPSLDFAERLAVALTPGTGGGDNCDIVYAADVSIAASGNVDLDLAGALTDPLGNTLTFARVKGIIVQSVSTNPGNLVIGNAASNEFAGPLSADATVTLTPSGVFAVFQPGAGWTVTAGTGDLLRIANSGAVTATAKVMIFGVSAA